MSKIRYFYFSASYSTGFQTNIDTFGIRRVNFPVLTDLHEVVTKDNVGARNIVILSISEMSESELRGLLPEGIELPAIQS